MENSKRNCGAKKMRKLLAISMSALLLSLPTISYATSAPSLSQLSPILLSAGEKAPYSGALLSIDRMRNLDEKMQDDEQLINNPKPCVCDSCGELIVPSLITGAL